MVLLIKEVDLRIKLRHNLLVLVLVKLHCEFVIVLTALIKLTKTQNFNITLLDRLVAVPKLSF